MDSALIDTPVGGALEHSLYALLRQRLTQWKTITLPAVGAEIVVPVPVGVVWELTGFHCRLLTSAVVANRIPKLTIQDTNGNEQARFPQVSLQAASTTGIYDWWQGIGTSLGNAGTVAPLPDPPLIVPGGFQFATVTSALDVGDAYTQITLCVLEWSVAQAEDALQWLGTRLR